MSIQAIFCNPPLVIARLGGSTVPMQAFSWQENPNPHVIGETQIKPEWTLNVESDGSVTPVMPAEFVLKDNGQIRPVAPFVELWCDVGDDGDTENWERQPLTKSILAEHGLNASNITFKARAMNMKAARRTGNPNLNYGTVLSVTVRGGEHQQKALLGESLAAPGAEKMIPEGRSIPLGLIQMIRPGDQPADDEGIVWADAVNVETIRLRVTPAKGLFYGPPGTAAPIEPATSSRGFSAVQQGNDFLNPNAGWEGATTTGITVEAGQRPRGLAIPGDTYDGAERQDTRSLGIIDDTCEIELTAELNQSPIDRPTLDARATVFCGPPDYSPDRRPFLSLADSLGDRVSGNAERSAAMTDLELDRWVEDLFERAFETVSLMNVDVWRNIRGAEIPEAKRRDLPIEGDGTRSPGDALGALDTLRDEEIELAAPSANTPLPVFDRAHERHRDLSDIVALKQFVRENPNRLEALVRKPFFRDEEENAGATNMQMPPFMRNSNAQPLTLANWQYELLMEWQKRVLEGPVIIEEEGRVAADLSDAAKVRRLKVLSRLNASSEAF